jgi:hypothetical protein
MGLGLNIEQYVKRTCADAGKPRFHGAGWPMICFSAQASRHRASLGWVGSPVGE